VVGEVPRGLSTDTTSPANRRAPLAPAATNLRGRLGSAGVAGCGCLGVADSARTLRQRQKVVCCLIVCGCAERIRSVGQLNLVDFRTHSADLGVENEVSSHCEKDIAQLHSPAFATDFGNPIIPVHVDFRDDTLDLTFDLYGAIAAAVTLTGYENKVQ
jgi:hypothetical protein